MAVIRVMPSSNARPRWATFSVKDHQRALPFVVDVLLYDQLIIPAPPPDNIGRRMWSESKWDPDAFDRIRKHLHKDVATFVPWGKQEREMFRAREELARAKQAANAGQGYFVDRQGRTRQMLAALVAKGNRTPWVVTAYPSAEEAKADINPAAGAASRGRREVKRARMALALAANFLVPRGGKDPLALLRDAVALAVDSDFRKKRSAFYKWQHDVITQKRSEKEVMGAMASALKEYNGVVRRAFRHTVGTTVVTLVPIVASAVTGAAPVGTATRILVGGLNLGLGITRLFAFSRPPNLDHHAGAMFHDARRRVFGVPR